MFCGRCGQVHVSFFVAGAAFGGVHVSFFVAGAAFGEVHVSLFVAGAAFGEVHVSLFLACAARGEISNDGRSGKRCNFQQNLLPWRRGGFSFAFSGSDHGRIGLGSWSDRSRIGNDVSPVFSQFLCDVGWSFCVAGAVFGEVGG